MHKFRRWSADDGEGPARKKSGSFMSLCDDRLCVTTGQSVSLCLIPLERLTLTQGVGLSPASTFFWPRSVCSMYMCLCASVNMPVYPVLHLRVMLAVAHVSFCQSVWETGRVCERSCLLAVTWCNSAGLRWSHTDSCELSLRTHMQRPAFFYSLHACSFDALFSWMAG